ncbi:hypothetical protein KM043_005191 [Ampulex compressa]|nr:hypothetical protein KM043_005191 [Ampulex compressa]
MVAELSGISVANSERRVSIGGPGKNRSSAKQRKRPKWIQAATREPIYSVLDSNETTTASLPPGLKAKVVVISAVKSETTRKIDSDEQRELPYVWLPSENKSQEQPEFEVEDEDALYSVVRKPKKVQLPKSNTFGGTLRPIEESSFEDKTGEPGSLSRQEELKRWLQVASKQLPEPRRLFDTSQMYTNDPDDVDPLQADWKRSVGMPRGVVGLVGPYRVYTNPNERREYMLQEEELVEEVVDSVSEVAARSNVAQGEHHQRAKWRLREEDEETLVPDIRNLPGFEDFQAESMLNAQDQGNLSEWKHVGGEIADVDDVKDRDTKFGREEYRCATEGILSGKEERAVDVPDQSSTASSSLKIKKGEAS